MQGKKKKKGLGKLFKIFPLCPSNHFSNTHTPPPSNSCFKITGKQNYEPLGKGNRDKMLK